MKLVRQTRLVFVEGRSEKVYEVDLCEVGANQYVVNFRYGKRGATLKDGSKTVAPVKRDEADRVFAKLVQSKLDSGYLDEAAPRPAPAVPARVAAPTAPATGDHPRVARLLERLAATGTARRWFRSGEAKTWPLERAIWRAGELRLRAAEPLLLALVGTATSTELAGGGKGLRDYCIAWALARCGSSAALPALTTLYGNPRSPEHVRRIAAEALMRLGDAASTAEFRAHVVTQLPEPLRAAASGDDPEAMLRATAGFDFERHPDALDQLYLIDSPVVRPALLAALAQVPLTGPLFRAVRHVWKAAELRADARVLGLLAYRIETTPSQAGRGPRYPFNHRMRRYLRRRVWRTLRRLGQLGDLDYTTLAAGVLLAVTDADGREPRSATDGRGRPFHYDRFARFLAWNHILYGASARYHLPKNGKAWRLRAPHRPDAPPPSTREEAFSTLWEQRPAALMQLCAESACLPVHQFAAKALLACPAFLDQLDVDDAALLLGRPYDPTAAVGLVVARKRYDEAHPDLALLAAAACSLHGPAREQGRAWIDRHRAVALADSRLLAALVLAPHADTRGFARQLLVATPLAPAIGQAVLGRLIAALLALGPADDAIAADATRTITSTLTAHLATAGVAVIRDLLAHPLAGVQGLGAELLLRHDGRTGLLPAELILAVLHSAHADVRALGMRLISEQPDDALAAMPDLLVRLGCDGNADIRHAARPLIARVVAAHPEAGPAIAAGLIEALIRRRLAEDVPSDVLRIVRDDLRATHPTIDRDTILRLLGSGSPHAQELGGRLLATNLGPRDLTIDEIIPLASHEILSVRQAAWALYERDLERVLAELPAAIRILDARWEDSRQWGFAFFRGPAFTRAHLTAEVLVGVIDSVRPDVMAFGRELLSRHFDDADGPTLLARLAEHPTSAVQLFTTNYLERFATGRPERLPALVPYFASVLSRVNHGRIAKQRVLAFLAAEGSRDDRAAAVVMPLLFRLAATVSVEYRAGAVEAMMTIHRARPQVALPIQVRPIRVLAAGGR